MKKTILAGLAVGLMLVGMVESAQAVVFNVNNSSISSIVSNSGNDNNDFIWNVGAVSLNSSNDLTVGSSFTFTYGSFSTNDFFISAKDYNDNVGSFVAGFNVVSPTPIINSSATGSPDAVGNAPTNNGANTVVVNGAVNVIFGAPSPSNPLGFTTTDGFGTYDIKFNDLVGITQNGTYDLTATIKLDSYVLNPPVSAPVPEPGTIMLVGAGLLGLAIYGKRRMNKED